MKKVCLFMGMLLLLSPLYDCKKKGKKDTKDKGEPSAMTAADGMDAPDGMKPAADSGLVKVDGVKKPEHEKIECPNENYCKITVVTEKVKKELESKKNYQKMIIGISAKTTNEFFKTLANIPWVTELKVYAPQVTDISSLAKLKNLKRLSLKCKAKDLSPLKGLVRMTSLTMQHHHFADLSPLKDLTGMTFMDISWPKAPVKSVAFLKGMSKLKTLYIHTYKDVKDISAMAGLTSLEKLGMEEWTITDISPLAGLKSLKVLLVSKGVKKKGIKLLKKAIKGIDIKVAKE